MKLLLDTHTFVWWNEEKLTPYIRGVIEAADQVFVSAASGWEIAIKMALGKLRMRDAVDIADVVAKYGFVELPVTLRHADVVRTLPLHHGDPFDRLLIAQAVSEGLTVVTADRKFEPYRVLVQWI